jgi:hypothetical protein
MRGDVTLSLGTRIFREAEYLAQLMAFSFEEVIARPMTSDDFRSILRDYLNERLAKARSRLLATPYGIAAFNREAEDYDTALELIGPLRKT